MKKFLKKKKDFKTFQVYSYQGFPNFTVPCMLFQNFSSLQFINFKDNISEILL